MNLRDVLIYIAPYVKILSKKGGGNYLLMDNLLIFNNSEDSILSVLYLPQHTSMVLCMEKKELLDTINNIDNINLLMVNIMDYSIYYGLFRKYKTFSEMNNPIVSMNNLENIEEVQGFLKMKSKDPLNLFNIDSNILLPFFYGIIPATKSDNINMAIFNSDEISHIVKYTITRSKPKCIIHTYMRLMIMK